MLRLPQADHRPLKKVALPLVVAQARLAGGGDVDGGVLSRFQNLLEGAGLPMPRVSPLQLNQVILGSSPEPVMSRTGGYQLTSEDEKWTATITSESVALETPAFTSYGEVFRPRWHEVVNAATELLRPVTLTRAGLRFVNVLHAPEEHSNSPWARWLHPALVAVLDDPWLSEGILAHAQQLQLNLGDGVQCGLRSGSLEGGDYLLDIDNYLELGVIWSETRVMDQFDTLNSCGVAVFQSMISSEMLEFLRGGQVREGEQDE